MVNNFTKHIILLLTCWCCFIIAAHGQRSDTTQNTTTATDSTVESSNTDTTTVSELDKFSKKDTISVSERYVPPSSIQKIKSDEDFWYANKGQKKKKEEQSPGFWSKLLSSGLFHFIFWAIVIGAFVAIIVMYLMSNKVWLFSSGSKKIYTEEKPPEDASGNIFTIDFELQINRALEASNYRLATRLLFLRLLRSMSERNIIQYEADKTNMDYLFELSRTKYFKDFSQASRHYEYVWYGNFDVKQNQFMYIKEKLEAFNRQIKN
jgi:hypothetical protein